MLGAGSDGFGLVMDNNAESVVVNGTLSAGYIVGATTATTAGFVVTDNSVRLRWIWRNATHPAAYTVAAVSSKPSVLRDEDIAVTVAPSGLLPQSWQPFAVNFTCIEAGTVAITLAITVQPQGEQPSARAGVQFPSCVRHRRCR